MFHALVTAGAMLAAGGLVAGVAKAAPAKIPHCAPGDPLVFVETATHHVHKAGSAMYERNMALAQDGHKTPSGTFMCASEAKKKGLSPTGGVPPHQK